MDQIELLSLLEELAPPALATHWDNSGLQVAAYRKEISHIAVSLDPSTESVQKALNFGADFIFTHHPLKLSPCYPNRLDTYHSILSLLFTHDTPLYSAHTNLDSMPVAAWLADELNLKHRVVLEETGSFETSTPILKSKNYNTNINTNSVELNNNTNTITQKAGIGIAGSFSYPIDNNQFITLIQTLIPHTTPFSLIGTIPETITRIAICPGSGSSLIEEAKKQGAQVFITGDIKYHTALDFLDTLKPSPHYTKHKPLSHLPPLLSSSLEFPLETSTLQACTLQCLIDVGHFSLEEEMMRRFSLILQEKLTQKNKNVRVTFIQSHDPFALIKE